MTVSGGEIKDRRSTGLLRVPFVRRCLLDLSDGTSTDGFIVNINVLGAYVSPARMLSVGETVRCRFRMPGNERELAVGGVVVWVNVSQSHPVHSLPPGLGIKFRDLSDESRARIEGVVQDYVARHPGAR
jgi:Tfp pilus assembly protein PilZ